MFEGKQAKKRTFFTYNQNETVEIFRTYNEERGLGSATGEGKHIYLLIFISFFTSSIIFSPQSMCEWEEYMQTIFIFFIRSPTMIAIYFTSKKYL